MLGVAVFACDSLGSLGIGILVGMLTALLTRVTHHVKREYFVLSTLYNENKEHQIQFLMSFKGSALMADCVSTSLHGINLLKFTLKPPKMAPVTKTSKMAMNSQVEVKFQLLSLLKVG